MKKICIVGTGYVGLVQGVLLSDFGMDVTCVDVDAAKIELLNSGGVPIYEPGLKDMLDKNVKAGRLHFSTDIKVSVENSLVIFVAVGTPPAEDGSADLRYVMEVARSVGKYMNGYKVIVDKSTVPVGTGRKVRQAILEELNARGESFEFDIVSNPEFLREGKAVKDCQTPDRVVLGCESEKAEAIMKEVYDVLYINQTPFVMTNVETAEMIKYASNAFLAVKISFINEMALLAEKVGANVQQISKAMGMDGRISPKFLHAGPGFGGSCFPKDTKAIASIAKDNGERLLVVEAAIDANEKQKQKAAEKIINAIGNVKGQTVAIWGLSFKPETDDMRDAPALDIIENLTGNGLIIKAFCPQGMREAKWRLKHLEDKITYCENEYVAVTGADALVIMTEWNQFRGADLRRVKELMKGDCLIDLRNIYNKQQFQDIGLKYYGIGIG
jgi:UDPglucose 6-dehydrogenase